jgi:hypothetical protein
MTRKARDDYQYANEAERATDTSPGLRKDLREMCDEIDRSRQYKTLSDAYVRAQLGDSCS